MINGSDMLSVKKSMQSSTLQFIQDLEDIIETHTNGEIELFVPSILYYSVDWGTMKTYFKLQHYYGVVDISNELEMDGHKGYKLTIVVDKQKQTVYNSNVGMTPTI